MKDIALVGVCILAGAAVAISFHGVWIGAWIGLTLLAFGITRTSCVPMALVGGYLGGVLFHLLALGWMRCAMSNAEALTLVHYLALGWLLTALLVRGLRFIPVFVAFPIAWTLGTAVPAWAGAAILGPPGHFTMNRIAPTQLNVPIVQFADVSGMAGVEFMIAATAGAVVEGRMRPLAVCLLLLISVSLYAHFRTGQLETAGTLRAALYQSAKPPLEQTNADVFVWPEGARWQDWPEGRWRRFADRLGGTVIVGASRIEGAKNYNSVIVATSERVRTVDKRYLVLGGETPSPVDWVTGASAGNVRIAIGKSPAIYECNGITLAICICYEITIPRLARNDAMLVVNPGSERSIACANGPETMLNHARMRAIESRRPVVRSVLGGHTAIIDGNGRVVASTVERPLVGEVPLDSRFSLYATLGDWVTPLCGILAAAFYLRRRRHP